MTEIILQTNDEQARLALRDITHQGNDYLCRIDVYSRGFSCDRPFYFSRHILHKFCDTICLIYESLAGECELRHEYENDVIRIQCNDLGHVEVFGVVSEQGAMTQRFEFYFVTDQTCLRGLIRDLKSLLSLSTPT